MAHQIFVGDHPLNVTSETIDGRLVELDGERFYRISNYDQMPPFFMTIVSSSDHWMFISSGGGLTAGRRNPEHALFPYTTDDKIHDAGETTGSKTVVLVSRGGPTRLWEPFSDRYRGVYNVQRNIYKHVLGNRVRFEEVNHDLGLTFLYDWTNSEAYGLVKQSRLVNQGVDSAEVRVLDGIQNLLPYGINREMQTNLSTLLDAYKKNELLADSGIGLFLLSSIPVDRPEPSEALKATTVWSTGLKSATRLLTTLQLNRFRLGEPVSEETDIRAERGGYLLQADFRLSANEERDWYFVIEGSQGPEEVASLSSMLSDPKDARSRLEEDIRRGSQRLLQIVSSADGLQETNDRLTCARHYSNVLFNVMRGGVPLSDYRIDRSDLLTYLEHHNKDVRGRCQPGLDALPDEVSLDELRRFAVESDDPDLERLCMEYLPLAFSRRHGDPSRPWNFFSIETRKEDGSQNLYYQGNWRDIFQNWEALSLSYPSFLAGMIWKFVNATTADGYNPYRITRNGIDWEIHDPSDPWSFIGYWGDHQIVYLLKLLENWRAHEPEALPQELSRRSFVFANVPYRIRPYEELLKNPHDTIVFDHDEQARVTDRVDALGADGKLVWNRTDGCHRVTFAEKLLIPALAKLSNFIPGAGIWMNTQRPEWNDANNALVGFGVSVVTTCYLRRYLSFLRDALDHTPADVLDLSEEVADHLQQVAETFERWKEHLDGPISDSTRKSILDELGRSGSAYRTRLYELGLSGIRRGLKTRRVSQFLDLALRYIDHTIRSNRRSDSLYHSYNLVDLSSDSELKVGRLYEMLEGQVAVLSSGCLAASESLEVLAALRQSSLYRKDQNSYILYPDRRLPRFTEKNCIPDDAVARSALLSRLIADGDRQLVARDMSGVAHFNGAFRNAQDVEVVLERLGEQGYRDEVERDRTLVLQTFEDMFNHAAYTGRSGTFFGYEGLGSIYWHMVSKLLLATKEVYFRAVAENEDTSVLRNLREVYYDIRDGIGVDKPPHVYGAFPIDPYSHTPGTAGAQQPGMTGQVKEDIIARWGELGVRIEDGCISFQPGLMRREELLKAPEEFAYTAVGGARRTLRLGANTLAFTYCQVPFVYQLGDMTAVVVKGDGLARELRGLSLDAAASRAIFERTGKIELVEVTLTTEQVR